MCNSVHFHVPYEMKRALARCIGGLEHLVGRRGGIRLQHGLGLVAVELPDRRGERLRRGVAARQHRARALLLRIRTREQRDLGLLAGLRDLGQRLRQEVPVHGRAEADALRLGGGLLDLLRGHGAKRGERVRPRGGGELHAVLLRFRKRSRGQAGDRRAAFADRAGHQAFESGEAISALTEIDPADSPAMVTRFGSPPNAAMFFCTHRSAATWSSRP